MATDELTHKAAEILGQFQALAPKTALVALEATRVDAYANILGGFEALVILAGIVIFWRKVYWPWQQKGSTGEVGSTLAGIGLGATIFFFAACVIMTILDPWTYVATQRPDLYLAHSVITKLNK